MNLTFHYSNHITMKEFDKKKTHLRKFKIMNGDKIEKSIVLEGKKLLNHYSSLECYNGEVTCFLQLSFCNFSCTD